MQNHMELFSTAEKLLAWCLRLRVQNDMVIQFADTG